MTEWLSLSLWDISLPSPWSDGFLNKVIFLVSTAHLLELLSCHVASKVSLDLVAVVENEETCMAKNWKRFQANAYKELRLSVNLTAWEAWILPKITWVNLEVDPLSQALRWDHKPSQHFDGSLVTDLEEHPVKPLPDFWPTELWHSKCLLFWALHDDSNVCKDLTMSWSDQIRSVTQLCPTLCDPMNRSTPGLPVHHQCPEFTQTHVHWVSDAIQPSHPLSSPSPPAPNPSQYQSLFQWVNSSHEVAKVLEFQR